MPSVRDYFEHEAGEYMDRLDALLEKPEPQVSELQRLSRALRGAAQMAREDRVQEVASSLEGAARALAAGSLAWSGDVRDRVASTVEDMRLLTAAAASPADLEERVARVVERWRELGVEPTYLGAASLAAGHGGGQRSDEFHRYAVVELDAVINELSSALPRLEHSATAREAVAGVLRRQRALLGAAHLDRLGPAAEALRAVDEVARTQAPYESDRGRAELQEFFRAARDALSAAVAALGRGDMPAPDPPFQKVVELRAKLTVDEEPDGAAAPETPATIDGDEFPVEVLNFFRSESATILARLKRIADELPRAGPDRTRELRQEIRDALNGLRDTARTFGFDTIARRAEQALGRSGRVEGAELRAFAEAVRTELDPEGPASEVPASEVPAGLAPSAASSIEPTAPDASAAVETLEGDVGAEEATTPSAPGARQLETQPRSTDASEPAAPPPPPGGDAGGGDVSIDDLVYRGEAALQRARALRAALQEGLSGDDLRALLDELFDLLELSQQ